MPTIKKCDSCNSNKKNVITKHLMKGFADFCPECLENLRWTSIVLERGTDWIVKKYPQKYVKFSKFSVTPLEST